jgi:predicted nucleotidyltransferase
MAAIPIPADQIAEFCRRHHIKKLALFGSVLRDDFSPDSDVDVLVEFEPGHTPGYGFIGIQEELSEFFEGHPVDLGTPDSLHPLIKKRVLRDAHVIYAG